MPSATSSIFTMLANQFYTDKHRSLTSLCISTTSRFCLLLHRVNVPFSMNGDTRISCEFSSNIPRRGRMKRCERDLHVMASRQKSLLSESLSNDEYRPKENLTMH